MKLGVLSIVIGNIVSKAIGVAREVFFAAWFGTGVTAAAFRIGQTGFLMPTHALIGDSLSAGLLPLYRQMQGESAQRARALVLVASIFGISFSSIITTLLYLFSSNIAQFIAPGASKAALDLASSLLRIMALATPFYVLSGMLSYLETAYGRYGAVAWRPMLLNIGSIVGATLAVLLNQDHWLAVGVLLSHIAFFLWTGLQLRRLEGIWPEAVPTLAVLGEVSGRFLRTLLPLLGLPLASQCSVLVERVVSSWLGTAVIPSVDYARFVSDTAVQLIAVPLGILTMSVHGGGTASDMRSHVVQVTRAVIVLAFPISAFVGLNAEGIVRLLFERGAFDAQSVETTSSVLRWMGASLCVTVTAYYLVKALNAQLRNREALVFTLIACGVNISLNLALWKFLGVQTLGVAVAGGSITLAFLCIRALRLAQTLAPLLAWMVPAVIVHVAASKAIQFAAGREDVTTLVLNALLATLLWGGLLITAPPMRIAAMPVLSRVPLLNRIYASKK